MSIGHGLAFPASPRGLSSSPRFSTPQYWAEFYKNAGQGTGSDWFGSFDDVLVTAILKREAGAVSLSAQASTEETGAAAAATAAARPLRVLHPGAGDSAHMLKLLVEAFPGAHVHSIDINAPALDRLEAETRSADYDSGGAATSSPTTLSFAVEDILELSPGLQAQAPFDLIFEKGMLDCFTADHTTASDRHPASNVAAKAYLTNLHGLLRPGGRFIQITEEPPELRLPLLEALWPSLPERGDGGSGDGDGGTARRRTRSVAQNVTDDDVPELLQFPEEVYLYVSSK